MKRLLIASVATLLIVAGYGQSPKPNMLLSVQNNVFTNSLNFSFQSALTAWSEITLVNVDGKEMFSIKLEAVKGENKVAINGLSHIASGLYTLCVVVGNNPMAIERIERVAGECATKR